MRRYSATPATHRPRLRKESGAALWRREMMRPHTRTEGARHLGWVSQPEPKIITVEPASSPSLTNILENLHRILREKPIWCRLIIVISYLPMSYWVLMAFIVNTVVRLLVTMVTEARAVLVLEAATDLIFYTACMICVNIHNPMLKGLDDFFRRTTVFTRKLEGHLVEAQQREAKHMAKLCVTVVRAATLNMFFGLALVFAVPFMTGELFYKTWPNVRWEDGAWFGVTAFLQSYALTAVFVLFGVEQSAHVGSVVLLFSLQRLLAHLVRHHRLVPAAAAVTEGRGSLKCGVPAEGAEGPDVRQLADLHRELCSLCRELDIVSADLMSTIFWACTFLFTFMLILVLTTGGQMSNFTILVTTSVSILWLCILGEALKVGSQMIADAVALSPWLDHPPAGRRILLQILMRSQTPEAVRVPKVGLLSLEVFMRMFNKWYNNLQFMRKMFN